MGREFMMPGQIYTGSNALDLAQEKLRTLGNKALVVTDKVMVELGNTVYLEKILSNQGISYVIYDGISGEPTDQMIEAGLVLYQNEKCDFLIGLGGGSPIDSMKAIGALVANQGHIADYMGKVLEKQTPPLVAIPTTAGTGSEATQFTIITDTKNNIKMLLKGPALMPEMAIIDPKFTMTAPPRVTSATGLDALTHAIEAYTSRRAQTLSDTFALSAIKKIFRYLPIAFKQKDNVEARENMANAALEAGIAFNNASVTIVHGMSRPIGALFHVPHGLSNAMLLRECLSFVVDGAYDRFAQLALEIGAADAGDSKEAAGKKFLIALEELCQELEIPTLEEYGVDKDEFGKLIDKMAHDAMESGSPQNTRKEISIEDVKEIYLRLML